MGVSKTIGRNLRREETRPKAEKLLTTSLLTQLHTGSILERNCKGKNMYQATGGHRVWSCKLLICCSVARKDVRAPPVQGGCWIKTHRELCFMSQ